MNSRSMFPAKTDGACFKGAWPAIRMLGVDEEEWPKNGEIDIVELRNGEPSVLMTLHSTNHHGAYGQNPPHNPLHLNTDMTKIPVIFGLEWHVKADEGQIDLTWWITSFDIPSQQWKNEKTTKSLFKSEGDTEDYAVFLKSFNEGGFYLLINLAQGGDFTGVYDKDALLEDGPQHVVIESAKVYEFPGLENEESVSCSFNDDQLIAIVDSDGQLSPHDTSALFKWENSIIPYFFTSTSEKDQKLFRSVMAIIER